MTLYNLRTAEGGAYRITKFTPDLDVESSYLIGAHVPHECTCPAGTRPSCRHRQMLGDLLLLVDTEFFWDFEHNMIVDGDGDQVTYLELEEALASSPAQRAMNAIYPSKPHSPTVTTPDFDSGDGGSSPPAVATPASPWRRL